MQRKLGYVTVTRLSFLPLRRHIYLHGIDMLIRNNAVSCAAKVTVKFCHYREVESMIMVRS